MPTPDLLQRGNAKYSWFWHGDPLTPGAAALPNAGRLDARTAATLAKIPVAVLSWGEARHILERLGGGAAPPGFQGALPFTYRVGADDVRVRLRVQMDDALRPIRDIVARVPGTLADRQVLLGTHHDAWTFGGVDPGTGTAALLELARGLAELRRGGWQPARTISLAFWDAEAAGLVGSTEYAEERREQWQAGTICYINTDLYTNGRLDAGGVPSLRDLVIDVTKDIREGSSSVYDQWRASEWARQSADRRQRGIRGFDVELKALGSGADFVPFQDHLGLPTLSNCRLRRLLLERRGRWPAARRADYAADHRACRRQRGRYPAERVAGQRADDRQAGAAARVHRVRSLVLGSGSRPAARRVGR
jgi:N-acetylated-alpha-linked acidic dipeptidase